VLSLVAKADDTVLDNLFCKTANRNGQEEIAMDPKQFSRRIALRSTAVVGLAAGALAGLTASRPAAAASSTLHPAVGVWENLSSRIDVPNQMFHNQFALLFGGVAIFASPPVDFEPGDDEEFTGPFFGVWEADGPTAIAFSVRHATYSRTVMVTGFEEMWGTAIVSQDGASLEVRRTFAESDASGGEQYRHSRTATFTRQRLRRNP
jgi:hypothetical protein